MESLSESIRAAIHTPSPGPRDSVPKAADVMKTDIITFSPDDTLGHVMQILIDRNISGAPIVDAKRVLLGIISAHDCLQLVASSLFHQDGIAFGVKAADYMSRDMRTVTPDTDLYTLANCFITHRLRRIPVVEDEKLVGLVTRSNVLKGILPK